MYRFKICFFLSPQNCESQAEWASAMLTVGVCRAASLEAFEGIKGFWAWAQGIATSGEGGHFGHFCFVFYVDLISRKKPSGNFGWE